MMNKQYVLVLSICLSLQGNVCPINGYFLAPPIINDQSLFLSVFSNTSEHHGAYASIESLYDRERTTILNTHKVEQTCRVREKLFWKSKKGFSEQQAEKAAVSIHSFECNPVIYDTGITDGCPVGFSNFCIPG